jgi:Family of unknown function (DUF6496)
MEVSATTPNLAGRGAGRMAEKEKDEGYSQEAREFISKEIKHHVDDQGMPQDQAVAAAMSEARRKGMKVPDEKK